MQEETSDYIVLVNENHCPEARERGLKHELEHIRRNDISAEESAIDIEKRMKMDEY